MPNNVIGPYQVLEAARMLGVPRVILASSGQVVDGYERDGLHSGEGRRAAATALPLRLHEGRFSKRSGKFIRGSTVSRCVAVRLGWCPRDAKQVEEIRRDERGQDVYLSPGDAGRFFAAAVEAEKLPPFAVLYATSRFTHKLRYDLSLTRELLGWEPREQWPKGDGSKFVRRCAMADFVVYDIRDEGLGSAHVGPALARLAVASLALRSIQARRRKQAAESSYVESC